MEVDLYGATLFLNPGKFFDIKENDPAYSSRLRMKFNDVLEKMVVETSVLEKISDQADQYENSRNAFGKQLTVRCWKTKNPLDWWGAFGGLTIELTMFAKRIVGLCCSSSGCECNWSTFEFIRTKKKNRLEHRRLNDLVYMQYNRKIAARFQKRRESGKKFDPLILDDFQWDKEWVNGEVVDPSDDEFWLSVDRALDALEGIESRRNPRRGGSDIVYSRCASGSSRTDASSEANWSEISPASRVINFRNEDDGSDQEAMRHGIAKMNNDAVIHSNKIIVGGHFYGAFMTVNLLAHAPNIFCCGIARPGAYNRTLTPFGFQNGGLDEILIKVHGPRICRVKHLITFEFKNCIYPG
ncbi:hypothetical protein OROMI_011241 [Orobanche minor]